MNVTVKIVGSKKIGLLIAGELTNKIKELYGMTKTQEVAPKYIAMAQVPEGNAFLTVIDMTLKKPEWIDEISLLCFKHRKTSITVRIN